MPFIIYNIYLETVGNTAPPVCHLLQFSYISKQKGLIVIDYKFTWKDMRTETGYIWHYFTFILPNELVMNAIKYTYIEKGCRFIIRLRSSVLCAVLFCRVRRCIFAQYQTKVCSKPMPCILMWLLCQTISCFCVIFILLFRNVSHS